MTINIPVGFAQATINYAGPTVTGKAATVLGFSLGEEGTLQGLCNGIEAAYNVNLAPYLHTAFTVTSVRAVDNENVHEKAVNIQGQMTGDLAPPNASLLVKKTSALRGRKFRGRNYWPGLMKDQNVLDDGTLIAGYVADMADAFDGFNTDLFTLGYFSVILHNDPETVPTPVTGGGVESRIATQRRRLR